MGLAGLLVGHDALGRGHDGSTQAAQDAGQLIGTGIDAQTGLGHPAPWAKAQTRNSGRKFPVYGVCAFTPFGQIRFCGFDIRANGAKAVNRSERLPAPRYLAACTGTETAGNL